MSGGHSYQFSLYAHEMWRAIFDVCSTATKSILFEHFILVDDEHGRPLINLLKKKALEGVKIRVLLDAVGSSHLFQNHLEKEFSSVGIELIFFNTIIPWTRRYQATVFFRDHRKLIIVDSKVAFTGGVCFEAYMRDWRDTAVKIEGSIVLDMEKSFEIMWRRAELKTHKRERRTEVSFEKPFVFMTSSPFPRKRYLYYELLKRLKRAKVEVKLTTPYFVPNHRLLRALRSAARRGVSVSLLIPEKGDHPIVDLAASTYFESLLKVGVKIFLTSSPFNHTKAGTIDGEWGTIGSLNLDYVSLRYNFEANIVTIDKNFVSELDSHFLVDVSKARQLNREEWEKRSWHVKLREYLIRPFRFLL